MAAYVRLHRNINEGAFRSRNGEIDYGTPVSCVISALSNLTPLPNVDEEVISGFGLSFFEMYQKQGLISHHLSEHKNGVYFYKAEEFVRIISGKLTEKEKEVIVAVDNKFYNYAGLRFVDSLEEDAYWENLTPNQFIEALYDAGFEVVITKENPIVEDHIQAIFGQDVEVENVFCAEDILLALAENV
jgi:hypothetical protein